MRTMDPLFCKEGLQGIFVILFTKYIMFFFCYSSLFRPLFRLHMICHSVSINIFNHYNFRSVENF